MTLHADWLKRDGYVAGGCWALFDGAGHLFLEAAQKGRHERTLRRLQALALLWNANRMAAEGMKK